MPLAFKASGLAGNSQRSTSSTSSSNCDCNNAMLDAPTQLDTATTILVECTLPIILIDYKQIDAYLTEIGALDKIVEVLDRIACLAQHAQGIKNAIQKLQQVVQKQAQLVLSATLTNNQRTYATIARKGIAQPHPLSTPTYKLVLTRYKRKIVVVCGSELDTQKVRSYKEIIEQLNKIGVAGEAAAVRWLLSGNIVLTIDNKQARTSWLTNQSWLSTFRTGVRVKRREFAVIAYGIQVN